MNFQKQNSRLQNENLGLQIENSDLWEDKLELLQHLKDLRLDAKTTKKTLNWKMKMEKLNEEVKQLKFEGRNPLKNQKVARDTHANTKVSTEDVIENYYLLIKAIEKKMTKKLARRY